MFVNYVGNSTEFWKYLSNLEKHFRIFDFTAYL